MARDFCVCGFVARAIIFNMVRLRGWAGCGALFVLLAHCASPPRSLPVPIHVPVAKLVNPDLIPIVDEELPAAQAPDEPYVPVSFSAESFHEARADLSILGTAFGRPILRSKTGFVEITRKGLLPRPALSRGVAADRTLSFFGRWPSDAYSNVRRDYALDSGIAVYKWTGAKWSEEPHVDVVMNTTYRTPRGQLAYYFPGATFGNARGSGRQASLRGEPQVKGFAPYHLETLSDGDVLAIDGAGTQSVRWSRTSHQIAKLPDGKWSKLIVGGTRAVAITSSDFSETLAAYDGKAWTVVPLPARSNVGVVHLEEDGTILCTLSKEDLSEDALWRKSPGSDWTRVAIIHSTQCWTTRVFAASGSIWLEAECIDDRLSQPGPKFTLTNHEAHETYKE